jgi:hypothetical protein
MPYPERLQDVEQRDRHAQLIMEGQSYSNCGSARGHQRVAVLVRFGTRPLSAEQVRS